MAFVPSSDLKACADNWQKARSKQQRQQCYDQALYELRAFVAIDTRSHSRNPKELQTKDLQQIDELTKGIRWFAEAITQEEERKGLKPAKLRRDREELESEITKAVLKSMQDDYRSVARTRLTALQEAEAKARKDRGEEDNVADQLADMEVSEGDEINSDESERSAEDEEDEDLKEFLTADLPSDNDDEDYVLSGEEDEADESDEDLEPGELEALQQS